MIWPFAVGVVSDVYSASFRSTAPVLLCPLAYLALFTVWLPILPVVIAVEAFCLAASRLLTSASV